MYIAPPPLLPPSFLEKVQLVMITAGQSQLKIAPPPLLPPSFSKNKLFVIVGVALELEQASRSQSRLDSAVADFEGVQLTQWKSFAQDAYEMGDLDRAAVTRAKLAKSKGVKARAASLGGGAS